VLSRPLVGVRHRARRRLRASARPNGDPDPALGTADPDELESLGEVYGQVNLEKLAALRPEIVVTVMWDDTTF
jgi:ABC-type Fe3+-hydroxamate transport system substrate-binding protein